MPGALTPYPHTCCPMARLLIYSAPSPCFSTDKFINSSDRHLFCVFFALYFQQTPPLSTHIIVVHYISSKLKSTLSLTFFDTAHASVYLLIIFYYCTDFKDRRAYSPTVIINLWALISSSIFFFLTHSHVVVRTDCHTIRPPFLSFQALSYIRHRHALSVTSTEDPCMFLRSLHSVI